VAVLAAGAATLGRVPLVAAVAVVQVVVALAWLAFLDAPAALVSFLIAIAAAGGCDVAALRHSGTALGGTVGVVAIAMMVALVVELGRKPRSRVTESLAATFSAVLVVGSLSQLLALSGARQGRHTVAVVAASGAAALLAVLSAAGVGAVLGNLTSPLSAASGAVVGVVVALAASAADLAVDLSAVDLVDARRRAAARPAAALLPFVAASPVAYATTRLLVG
jgi:hypothetical protein